jgi:hypothetical protein
MTVEEFCAICIARFGEGWQTKLAHSLGVNARTVRRWAAGEVPVPPPVAAQLGARPAIAQEYPDEWLIASDADEQREYVIHLATPRFVGMILDEEIAEGITLELRDEIVGRITWIDPPPADLLPLLRSLQKAMNIYSE